MLTRYGITAPKAFGVSVGAIQQLGKRWAATTTSPPRSGTTGWYEARMLTAFVDDPARVTAAQMDRWARDFDNWGICDTLCFALFDRTPHAWTKVEQWSKRREEFVKRAAFALLACARAARQGRPATRRSCKPSPLIERAATDDRNFVKKGVSWALRVVGRRNRALNDGRGGRSRGAWRNRPRRRRGGWERRHGRSSRVRPCSASSPSAAPPVPEAVNLTENLHDDGNRKSMSEDGNPRSRASSAGSTC